MWPPTRLLTGQNLFAFEVTPVCNHGEIFLSHGKAQVECDIDAVAHELSVTPDVAHFA